MILEKHFRGVDGKMRSWIIDTEDKSIYYSGIASDFKDKVFCIGTHEISKVNDQTAQELIDEADKGLYN